MGNNPFGDRGAEFNEKIEIEVRMISGEFVEKVVRTVMSNEGKRYITYKRKQYQVKKMKKGETFKLKIMGR